MEEIWHPPIEVGSLSHYLQGLIHPWWCRIPSINSIIHFLLWEPFFHSLFCHWKRTMACLSFPFFLVHSLIDLVELRREWCCIPRLIPTPDNFWTWQLRVILGFSTHLLYSTMEKRQKKTSQQKSDPPCICSTHPGLGKPRGNFQGTKTKKPPNNQRNRQTKIRRLLRETGEDGFEAIQLWRRWQGITWSLKSPSVVETSVVWNNSLGDERGTTVGKSEKSG